MDRRILITMAGVVVAMNSVSCLKESAIDQMYRPEGTEIIFAAADTYESIEEETRVDFYGPDSLIFDTAAAGEVEAETRTVFTNEGSSTIERINWVNGDSMSIEYERGSNRQTGVYGVISRSASGTKDNATVTNISGTTLNWLGGSGTHKFYAMYPEATFTSAANGPTIKGTIPSSQSVTWNDSQKKYLPSDMTKCYMVGYTTVNISSPTSRVAIPFVPAVTMFEFNLKRASSGTTYVKSATLTATNLTGTFQFKLTGGDSATGSNWWNHTTSGTNPTSLGTDTGNSITITFSGKGASMTNTSALNFTMLAIPLSYSNPVLTLVMSTDNGTTYFTKKVTLAKTFAACKKHVITNSKVPNEDWEYTFTHTGTTMTVGSISYQEIVRAQSSGGDTGTAGFTSSKKDKGSGETSIAVSDFTYAYAPDNNGSPGSFSTTKPTGLNSTTVSGSSTSKTIKGTWAANSGTSISTLTQLRGENMKSKGSVGSSSAPQDLALSTVASSGITFRSSGPTTANCYIVDRPGWYMFPLVYGNAIVNGSENSAAYTTSASVSNGWSTLHNYKGNNISSPYIPTDVSVTSISSSALNATIVWQDASGSTATATWDPTFISQVSVISKPSGATVNTSYIKFYVDPATVHPGNAVIALRNGNTIIWSWHIWLTDGVDTNGDGKGDGFPTFNVKKHPNWTNAKTENNFLQIPLGACETGTISPAITVSSERAGWVRVTQTASGKELYFRIVQQGSASSGSATITNKDISPTFYQWGRKDPFLPRKGGTTSSNKDCTGTSLTLGTDPDNTAAKSIMNPTVFYYVGNGYATNWLGVVVVNLWNMNQTSANQDRTVTKTVYDPCPPGFSLPNRNAFQNFATDGGNNNSNINAYGSWSNGYTFYTQAQGSGASFYFRAFGCRQSTTGAIGDVNSLLAYWTSSGTTNFCSNALSADPSQGQNVPRCYPFGSDRSSYGYPVYPAVQ